MKKILKLNKARETQQNFTQLWQELAVYTHIVAHEKGATKQLPFTDRHSVFYSLPVMFVLKLEHSVKTLLAAVLDYEKQLQ